jgi:ribosomal protein L7/L12
VTKKEFDLEVAEIMNPRILTLIEALALIENVDEQDTQSVHDAENQTMCAIVDRITTRFGSQNDFDQLNYGEKLVFEIVSMVGEVLNGGFHQYLFNSAGESAQDLKVYLKEIDATFTLELMDRVSSIFPDGVVPPDWDERNNIMMKIEEVNPEIELFLQETREFYNSHENLDRLIIEYILSHRKDFIEPNDEIVKNYKRRDRIQEHLGIQPEIPDQQEVEEFLKKLTEFTQAAEARWKKDELARIKEILRLNGKAAAMKIYRKAFSCTLDEAKRAIEELEEIS